MPGYDEFADHLTPGSDEVYTQGCTLRMSTLNASVDASVELDRHNGLAQSV